MPPATVTPFPANTPPIGGTLIDVHVRPVGTISHVSLHGELDIATTLALRQVLRGELEQGRIVDLDLSDVTFMDTSGARILAWLIDLTRGTDSRAFVTATSPATQRLLRAANAEHLLLQLQPPESVTAPVS